MLRPSITQLPERSSATPLLAAEAAAINAGNDTVFNYAQSLLDANISFSQVAMGMPSLMFNKTPSLATLDNITNVFLPPQVSLAIATRI